MATSFPPRLGASQSPSTGFVPAQPIVVAPVGPGAVPPFSGVTAQQINLSGNAITVGKTASPMLLLPLRIETRFMDSSSSPGSHSQSELWLRIFPDQLAIDSHDPSLTNDEFAAATWYWNAMGDSQMAGNTNAQRNAWSELASQFGPRRAAYVARATQPNNYDAWLAGLSTTLGPTTGPTAAGPFRPSSWSQPAVARALPVQWWVALYDTSASSPLCYQLTRPKKDLIVSPTPQNSNAGTPSTGAVTNDMNWLVDFNTALSVGMAVKIPITAVQRKNGFSQVVVLGISELNATAGGNTLQELFTAHRYTDGFSFVPQGTPTKNSIDAPSGYSRKENNYLDSFQSERQLPITDTVVAAVVGPADSSLTVANASALPPSGTIAIGAEHIGYNSVHGNQLSGLTRGLDGTTAITHSAGDYVTPVDSFFDGQFFADTLGLDRKKFHHIKNDNGLDQQDAINMATVLWPVTGGYFIPYMLGYQLAAYEPELRQFATTVMRARGPIPSFRVGKIPYGILPVTVPGSQEEPVPGRYTIWTKVLTNALNLWQLAVVNPNASGNNADAMTASILSQNASTCAIDAYLCYGPTLEWNIAQFNILSANPALTALGSFYLNGYFQSVGNTNGQLASLGLPPSSGLLSGIVAQSLSTRNLQLVGIKNVVSETDPLPNLNGPGTNYLQYFAGQSATSLFQSGIQNGQPTLLFRLVLQALLLEYAAVAGNVLNTPLTESEYPYPLSNPLAAGSFLWALFNTQYPGVPAGSPALADFIQGQVSPPTPRGLISYPTLTAIYDSIRALATRPTAALQRVLTETLDIWGYRLDAWWTGLATSRLMAQQASAQAPTATQGAKSQPPGILIGAWGYVESLRPAPPLQPLDASTLASVTAAGLAGSSTNLPDPVISPDDNGGFIYAPSLAHAATGAVLRNAYLSYLQSGQGPQCAIDLSSQRVRTALQLMEGVNQGQHLGALLGYRFESYLMSSDVPQFVSAFRQAYPIVANKMAGSGTGAAASVAASNVVDGAALQQAWVAGTIAWGTSFSDGSSLPAANGAGYTQVTAALNLLNQAVDAVSDLAVAEGVFQIVRGNPERSGGALNASSRDQPANEPQIVETPRSGIDFTQRLMSVFQVDLSSYPASVWLGSQTPTPRAMAEPFFEQWLGAVLPGPGSVLFQVTYTAPNATIPATVTCTLAQAGLSALDLLALTPLPPPLPLSTSSGSPNPNPLSGPEIANSQLEFWIISNLAMSSVIPVGSTAVSVAYGRDKLPTAPLTLPELLPLCRALNDMLGAARPITSQDFVIGGAQAGLPSANSDLTSRLTTASTNYITLCNNLAAALQASTYSTLAAALAGLSATPALANQLTGYLLIASGYGDAAAAPVTIGRDAKSIAQLITQAWNVLLRLQARSDTGVVSPSSFGTPAPPTSDGLFGKSFMMLPTFTPVYSPAPDPLASTLTQAIPAIAAWRAQPLSTVLGAAEVLQQMAHVRPAVARADLVMNLSTVAGQLVARNANMLGTPMPNVDVAQLPYNSSTSSLPWLALGLPTPTTPLAPGQFPWAGQLQGMYALLNWIPNQSQSVSLISLGNPPGGSGNLTSICGLMLDEWVEKIPNPVEKTAVALNYDEPGSRAPESMLLAVAPPSTSAWTAQLLVDTILHAISLAKARTVDYANLPPLGQILPALYTAFNPSRLTVSTRFDDLSVSPPRFTVPAQLIAKNIAPPIIPSSQ
jgi:hypothetical protein